MKRATWMLAALALLLGGRGQAKAGFVNGSFETGDFTGWITRDINPFISLAVGGAGISAGFGFFSTSPTDGQYVALTGFDGGGPGDIIVAQEVLVAPGISTVTFDYRAAWDMQFVGTSTAPRLFDVKILASKSPTPIR
jgi:hypothetical protein